jgi:hypothetical protein
LLTVCSTESLKAKLLITGIVLITLQAACEQKPALGQTLKIEGDIFSRTQLNITSSTTPTPTITPSTSSKPSTTLSAGTLIGIICAGLVILVVLSAVSFICYRKRRSSQRRSGKMGGKHYSRFNEPGISMPVMGSVAAQHQQRGRQDSESTILEKETKTGEAGLPSFQPRDDEEKLSANMVKGHSDGSRRKSFMKTIGTAR